MVWKTLRYAEIDTFKRSWPCHGLPDYLHSLSCEFASNGDLVDLEAYRHNDDGTETRLDTHDFDGLALAALTRDCQKFGDESD